MIYHKAYSLKAGNLLHIFFCVLRYVISMLRQHQVVMGQPIQPLLLQSHLPHYRLVCLAELQCKYLPPWSYTLSSGCHCRAAQT